jgi:hypothetical protein
MPENKNPSVATEEQIRNRAYEIYVKRGCEDGHDISDWLTAEREVKEVNARQSIANQTRSASPR